jgi:hypothetical protein
VTHDRGPAGPRGRGAGGVVVLVGIALVAASVILTFAKEGATTTSASHTYPGAVGGAETPSAFLDRLAANLRVGDTTALVGSLDPAVIGRFGLAACTAAVARLADPTAAFAVQHVGAPGTYAFTTGGTTTEVADTVAVTAAVTNHGTTSTRTVHLARLPTGGYGWFTACS